MADQDDLAAAPMMQLRLAMHLRDQRAGGVDGEQVARAGPPRGTDFGTPCAEKITGASVVRNLVELLDEDRALALQALDHVLVMDDLVAHIDRRAVFRERLLDRVDGAHHAGAEAARRAEQDIERRLRHGGSDVAKGTPPVSSRRCRVRPPFDAPPCGQAIALGRCAAPR